MISDTETVSELEEMLEHEIPCTGMALPVNRDCGKPATMAVVYYHDCPHPDALKRMFKCFDCYQANYTYNVVAMATKGTHCMYCKRVWPKDSDINTFMRYAPL